MQELFWGEIFSPFCRKSRRKWFNGRKNLAKIWKKKQYMNLKKLKWLNLLTELRKYLTYFSLLRPFLLTRFSDQNTGIILAWKFGKRESLVRPKFARNCLNLLSEKFNFNTLFFPYFGVRDFFSHYVIFCEIFCQKLRKSLTILIATPKIIPENNDHLQFSALDNFLVW